MRHNRVTDSSPSELRCPLEIRVISAQDLKDVKLLGKMKTYAVAYVDSEHKARTHVDEKGGVNPVWNEVLNLSVPEYRLQDDLAYLTIEIYCQGHLHEKLVGTVRILLADALRGENENPIRCQAFWVRLPSGDPQGILNVWIPPKGRFLRHQDSGSVKGREEAQEDGKELDSFSIQHLAAERRELGLP